MDLLPWQATGLTRLLDIGRAAFIYDQTGLGKSRLAIAYILRLLGSVSGLKIIVAPGAVLQHKWVQELAAVGETGAVIKSLADLGKAGDATWLVVSYDCIRCSLGPWLRMQAQAGALAAVIYDEAHYLKSPKAKRTEGWKDIQWCRNGGIRLFLTATPVDKSPLDIISLYEVAGLRQEAKALYDNTWWEWSRLKRCNECKGWKDEERAARLLSRRKLRRTKQEVFGSSLPPMLDSSLDVPVQESRLRELVLDRLVKDGAQPKKAEEALDRLAAYLSGGGVEPTPQGMRLVQEVLFASSMLKAEPLAEYVADMAANEPVVVFGLHRDPLVAMEKFLAKRKVPAYRVDGTMGDRERRDKVDGFMAGSRNVIIGTYKTLGVGIDLIRAKQMIILEQDWSPGVMEQAKNRIHRIGQTGQTYCAVALAKAGGSMVQIEHSIAANHRRKNKHSQGAGFGVLGVNPSPSMQGALI